MWSLCPSKEMHRICTALVRIWDKRQKCTDYRHIRKNVKSDMTLRQEHHVKITSSRVDFVYKYVESTESAHTVFGIDLGSLIPFGNSDPNERPINHSCQNPE